jgi:VIT1/CCC1 family predicted Fe2+/Mn2+ transporter
VGGKVPDGTSERVGHEPESSRPADLLRHYIGDLVYGANDGIVTTFAVVSGISGAALEAKVILIVGLANLLADGFSMAASNFLAIRSESAAAGMERGRREPLKHALATFWAFALAGAIPLLPYLIPGAAAHAFWVSSVAAGGALFAVGAARALVVPRGWVRCGVEMLGVGAAAGAVAFGVGAAVAGWLL